jgi:hypothetical protein
MNPANNQVVTGPPRSGCVGTVLALIGAGLSILFLANPTFGIVEIPDNLPFVGNIDEVVVSGILFACLSRLGINPIPTFRRNAPAPPNQRTQ